MKKTKKDFLENHASHPELARKALNAGRVNWNDIIKHPDDYCAADTGSVPGMIYYRDTVKFAKKNIHLILDALREFEENVGTLKNVPKHSDGETAFFNWLAWFAWENTMYEIINYLEQ